jgi:DNA-binding beta-propeller fold protein YncE
MKKGSGPWGIVERDGVIAVSLCNAHAVTLLHYESGAVKSEVTIGAGTAGNADGQLCFPCGISFTADGRYLLVADFCNDRVSKFCAASGAFIAHVIKISQPRYVVQCEDGSTAVAQDYTHGNGSSPSVVCVGEDGGLVQHIIIPSIGRLRRRHTGFLPAVAVWFVRL